MLQCTWFGSGMQTMAVAILVGGLLDSCVWLIRPPLEHIPLNECKRRRVLVDILFIELEKHKRTVICAGDQFQSLQWMLEIMQVLNALVYSL